MNIGSISNLSFNARMLKNVLVYDKNGNIIKKDINIEETNTSRTDNNSPDIIYKNGDEENFADYDSYINVPGLAYDTLKQINNNNAFIDMHNMQENYRTEDKDTDGKKAKISCFTFQIEGTDKPYTVNYCFERELENPKPTMSYNA